MLIKQKEPLTVTRSEALYSLPALLFISALLN